jgi:hypothetical protein
MGREKLREGLDGLAGLAGRAFASSHSATFDNLFACRDVVGGGLLIRPAPWTGVVGEVTRSVRSRLKVL